MWNMFIPCPSVDMTNAFPLHFVPVPSNVPGCGGNAVVLSDGSDLFSSPGYDGHTPYGSSASCAWMISARVGKVRGRSNVIFYVIL